MFSLLCNLECSPIIHSVFSLRLRFTFYRCGRYGRFNGVTDLSKWFTSKSNGKIGPISGTIKTLNTLFSWAWHGSVDPSWKKGEQSLKVYYEIIPLDVNRSLRVMVNVIVKPNWGTLFFLYLTAGFRTKYWFSYHPQSLFIMDGNPDKESRKKSSSVSGPATKA